MKYCPRCGKENVDISNFCTRCGAPLPPAQPQTQVPFQPDQPDAPAGQPRKSGWIFLLIIGCVVVMLISAIIVILIRTGGNKGSDNSSRPSHATTRDDDEDEDEEEEEQEEEKKTSSSSESKAEEKKAKKTYVIEVYGDHLDTTRYFYDALGRTERVEYASTPHGYAEKWTTYEFGVTGKLSRRSKSDGSYIEYDLEGREILSVDTNGWEIKTTYDADGNVIDLLATTEHHYMEYDWQGRIIRETVNNILDDGTETLRIEATYEYSDDGLEKYMTTYNTETGVTRLTTEWHYDEAGNEIFYHLYSRSGENDSIRETGYDADGNVLWEQYLAVDGTLTKRTEYTYDAQGNLLESVETGYLAGSGTVTTTYERDGNGRLLTVTRHEVNPGSSMAYEATWITDLYEYTDRGDVRYHYEYSVGVDVTVEPYYFWDKYLEQGKEYFSSVTVYLYDYDTVDPESLIPERKY